jgi:hypothetical protein
VTRRPAEAGYTFVELLIATALALLLAATTGWLVADIRTAVDVSRERSDLHQRGRVGLEAIALRLRDAGAGANRAPLAGSLIRWMPPIWPGREDRVSVTDAVTTIRVLPGIQPARLAADAGAAASSLILDRAGCALPCGFFDGMTVALLDGRGDFDLFSVDETDGGWATVRRLAGGTNAAYSRGTAVLPVAVRVLYFNAAALELRADDGDRGDFPVVDGVSEVRLEFAGDPRPPQEPRPPPGEENCLYDSAGTPRADLATLPASGGTMAPLSAAMFEDGPWCGAGGEPFDADLLRIRVVRLRVRLQASSPAHRGADTLRFRSPGIATDPSRMVADLVLETVLSPRNLGGWR